MLNSKRLVLLTIMALLQTSCVLTKSELSLSLPDKIKNSTTKNSINVTAVSFENNQIKITGTNLKDVSDLKLKNNSIDEEFIIESTSSNQIVAKAGRALSISLDQAFDLILSSANASATFPISFTIDSGEFVATMIEVTGEIKLGNSGIACSAANEGSQRYNSSSKVMEFCNGTTWASFSPGASENPVATVISTAATTTPSGYLLCNGAAVSRTTYSALFAAVGTTYGAGDGSTTFNLPDMRGRTPLGQGSGPGLTPRSLGAVGGTELVNGFVTTVISVGTSTSDGQTNAVSGNHGLTATASSGPQSASVYLPSGTAQTAPVALGGVSTTSTGFNGGDGTDANMQPFTVLKYAIKY